MDGSYNLAIPADIHEIPRVLGVIDQAMRAGGFSDDAILDLQLAVEEAVVNTVVHGYRGASGEVAIAIHLTDGQIEIRIEDHAPPFDPLSLPDPNRECDLDERSIGGLGIFLIRQVVDEVAYHYTGQKNVLTLIKRKAT